MNFDGLSWFRANFGLTSALLHPRHMKCVRRHIFLSLLPFVRSFVCHFARPFSNFTSKFCNKLLDCSHLSHNISNFFRIWFMISFVALLMMWNIYTFTSGPWCDQESIIRTV